MSKNGSSNLEWVQANYISTITLTCSPDVEGSLHHRYFCIYSSNDANKYAVYLDISGSVMATPTGYNGVIACDLTASGNNSTASQVGNAIQISLEAHADFSATDNNAGVVTITGQTNLTSASPSVDVDTGFFFSITDSEVSNEVLKTDSSGAFKFQPFSDLLAEIGSNDKNYVHTQNEPSETWTITHNLAKYPSVSVVDSAGTVVYGQIDYNSTNQATLTFSSSFSGKAYFN